MAKSKANNSSNSNSIGGVVFVGCLFVGMGIGALFSQAGAGTLIGLGVGFIAMAWLRMKH